MQRDWIGYPWNIERKAYYGEGKIYQADKNRVLK